MKELVLGKLDEELLTLWGDSVSDKPNVLRSTYGAVVQVIGVRKWVRIRLL